MISFKHKVNFSKTTRYFKRVQNATEAIDFHKYGQAGVAALSSTTPIKTGLTSQSWYYKIRERKGVVTLSFHNSNLENGVPIAIVLQYGHGTRYGGWVEGRDYINPSIQPLFDQIVNDAWREVSKI